MKKKGYIFIANGRKGSSGEEDSISSIKIGSFEKSSITAAEKLGFKLYMGVNRSYPEKLKAVDSDITFYNQHIYRNILNIKDIYIGCKNLYSFIKKHPDISIIHCNTPIGGVIGRLVGKLCNKTVIYTAHGFHFYRGAPLINRTLFKWIEQWLAHYTDVIITINQEDYTAATNFKLKEGGRIYLVPGVGVELANLRPQRNRGEVRESLRVKDEDFLCITIGDLNDNKNIITQLHTIERIKDKHVKLIICGVGPLEYQYKKEIIKAGLEDRITLLGYRKDVYDLLNASDLFIMSSKREGLPRSTMEAMAMGLPCVVSDIRGNRDLIVDGQGGFLVSPYDEDKFVQSILFLQQDLVMRNRMSQYNREKIKDFSIEIVENRLVEIFEAV